MLKDFLLSMSIQTNSNSNNCAFVIQDPYEPHQVRNIVDNKLEICTSIQQGLDTICILSRQKGSFWVWEIAGKREIAQMLKN